MTHSGTFSRRTLLHGTSAASAGLVIGTCLPFRSKKAQAAAPLANDAPFKPNAFIRIGKDSVVTVMIRNIEFGQGPATGLATLVAEELDADWSQVRAELAPAAPEYFNELFRMQGTGGSTSIASGFTVMRKAGAAARSMLVDAAAKKWGVPAAEISVSKGEIAHAGSSKKGSFGEFAELAASETMPKNPTLKEAKDWTLIGKEDLPKLDSKAKSNGTLLFTLDRYPKNAVTAVVAHPPAFKAKPKSFNAEKTKAVPGVLEVIQISSGVAVIAKNTYAALRGRALLEVQWDMSGAETRSTETMFAEQLKIVRTPGTQAELVGDIGGAFSPQHKVIEAEFQFPFLAHAPMEPLDAVIEVRDGEVEYWSGSQFPTMDQTVIARVFGLAPAKAIVNVDYAGGSFGRRATGGSEFAKEVAEIAKAWGTKSPLRVMWTRVDDIRGGFYRPMTTHRIRASVNASGQIDGWDHVVAGNNISFGADGSNPENESGSSGSGKVDNMMLEGAKELTYKFPNRRLGAHTVLTKVPTLWWRSVGHTHTAYAVETMVDEVLELAGKDPVKGRVELMAGATRKIGVLNKVAEMAGWTGAKVGKGRARGVAVHKSFRSYVAQIVEVSKGDDGLPKVEKVWCAVDCGIPVNPDIIRAQMEGGIGYGLSAALFSEINIDEGGKVRESNFNDYRNLRINECPEIEVAVIASTESPTGVGEPGLPPLAPALANAWRVLTGEKMRRLPFARSILGGA